MTKDQGFSCIHSYTVPGCPSCEARVREMVSSNEQLYQRVLAQFERYAGDDDCIDLAPVREISDEIERLTRERDEFREWCRQRLQKNDRLRAALAEIVALEVHGSHNFYRATGLAREALRGADN